MDELIIKPSDMDLVEIMHSSPEAPPMPFERDIFLLGIQIAGTNHIPQMERLYGSIEEGDRVKLVREPENPYDEYAVRIDTADDEPIGYLWSEAADLPEGEKLGYIPRYTDKVFARLMDAGKLLYGVVRHKEMVGTYYSIIVKIYMND